MEHQRYVPSEDTYRLVHELSRGKRKVLVEETTLQASNTEAHHSTHDGGQNGPEDDLTQGGLQLLGNGGRLVTGSLGPRLRPGPYQLGQLRPC